MDWTMVGNATGTEQRLQTLVYLLCVRYEADAQEAGEQLGKEAAGNPLCRLILEELRSELASPSMKVGVGLLVSEAEAREYLAAVLRFSQSRESPSGDLPSKAEGA